MHAATFAVAPTPAAIIGGRAPQRTVRRHRRAHVVARVDSQEDAAASSMSPSSSRRGTLFAGMAGVVVGVGAPPRARAVEPPATPDASNSAYIQKLLANTEANKDRRLIERQNKYCLRQSELGIGDCAGLPEDDMKKAMDESLKRLERKKAAEQEAVAAEAAEAEKAEKAAEAASAAAAEAAAAAVAGVVDVEG